MKSLIFLLFITFISSDINPNGLINKKVYIGGKIENGRCKCPNKKALIGYECKPCIGGKIIFNRCRCTPMQYLIEMHSENEIIELEGEFKINK